MGMPITVEILDRRVTEDVLDMIFSYFQYIDEKFSTYKTTSEITRINNHQITEAEYSEDMRTVLRLSEETKRLTNGYFNIVRHGRYDPSGLVKGWSIYNAAKRLDEAGYKHFYIDAGGDIEARGENSRGLNWQVGIRDPFSADKIVKAVYLKDQGIATSGTYIRGQHIYNPNGDEALLDEIVSLTVIGPNVYEADRFATAAFAMGKKGISFIAALPGFEGYMIEENGLAVATSGFEEYTKEI